MTSITTPILPQQQTFVKVQGAHKLHLEAICVFAAIGFFLDEDTYWRNEKVLRPAAHHDFDSQGYLKTSTPWFQWHYSPRDLTFEQALEEYTQLFETIVAEQSYREKVILPLSGGLDSRTQAAALTYCKADVHAYSYEFENGYGETKIAQKIAEVCGFEFQAFKIPNGYLWDCIDQLSRLNGCYSDFTAPRQMAIFEAFDTMGSSFSLGHWGDVLFDNMHLDQLTADEELAVLKSKLLKKGGAQLAQTLWTAWDLEGDFDAYFTARLRQLLNGIGITDSNAKLRAFKSLYWAPRWTSVNLSVFEAKHPVRLPYYDDRMCQFICSIPEAYLKDRRLQIAYLKARSPKLARIPWQDHRPFNLYTYHRNKPPFNLPYKVGNKLSRMAKAAIGQKYIQRNWELQFLGEPNGRHLQHHLLESGLKNWIPESILKQYYQAFTTENSLMNAHAINMLLVFSKFHQHQVHA